MARIEKRICELKELVTKLKNKIDKYGITKVEAGAGHRRTNIAYAWLVEMPEEAGEILSKYAKHEKVYYMYEDLLAYQKTIKDFNSGLLMRVTKKFLVIPHYCRVVTPIGFHPNSKVVRVSFTSGVKQTNAPPENQSDCKVYKI